MDYVTKLRKKAGHQPLILPGAVVIALNGKNEVLLQHRTDGSWGLPGGLMELGESLEETARREVKEETGLELGDLTLLGIYSGSDFYFKLPNGDELYSVTAVYQADRVEGILMPDFKESQDLKYFSKDNLPKEMTEEYKIYLTSYVNE